MADIKSFFEKQADWPKVKEVCDKLIAGGFKAYLAGGCVRDALLNRPPKDFDVATDAHPEEVEALFENTEAVGKSFGVILVKTSGQAIEVATFREDGEYKDGRHPESVKFSSAEEDAKRRDFTVNALFYDTQKNEIVDFVDGQSDLKNQILKAVGEPERRFTEDKLRLLRALRFSSELGFVIEEKTAAAIQKLAAEIKVVAKERRLHEMDRLLLGKNSFEAIKSLRELGLWQFQNDEHWEKLLNVWQQNKIESSLSVLWALFLPKDFSELQGLELPHQRRQEIEHFWRSEDEALSDNKLGRKIRLAGSRKPMELVRYLTAKSIAGTFCSELKKRLTSQGELVAPLVSGSDLSEKGVSPGPQMGEALHGLYEDQLEDLELTKEDVLKKI